MQLLSPQFFFLLFLAASLGGCSYQVIILSGHYFNYITSSKVDSQMEFNHKFPGIVICTPFNELSHTNYSHLTISEMFDLTPNAADTLLSCKFRLHHDNRMQTFDHDQCLNYFEIMKHYTAGSICYQYHPRSHLKYSISNVANAITDPLIVYVLYLSKELREVEQLQIFSTSVSHPKFPQYSRKFSQRTMNITVDNTILFRTKTDKYSLLPAPYDTHCDDTKLDSYADCLNQSTVKHLGRFPYTEVTSEAINLIPLSYSDLQNKSQAKVWKKLQDDCERDARAFRCTFTMTSTHVEHTFTNSTEYNDSLIIMASVPFSVGYTVTSKPTLIGIEFFSGLCSTIGTWFGFSVLSARPSRIRDYKKYIRRSFKFLNTRNSTILRKFANIVFIVCCFLGFSYQTHYVCTTYFTYKTTSKIVSNNQLNFNYKRLPSLSLCFPLTEMIDRPQEYRLNKYGLNKTSEGGREYEDQLAALTYKRIDKLTPQAIELVDHCSLRDTTYQMRYISKEDCVKRLSITKAVSGRHICYTANPTVNDTYLPVEAENSLGNSKEIYDLDLVSTISKTSYIVVTLYDYESTEMKYPTLSRNYAARLPFNNKSKESQDNDFFVGNTWFEFTLLPHPYDTNCMNDTEIYSCTRKCLLHNYRHIKRVPFSELRTAAEDYSPALTLKDMKNETIRKFVEKTERQCEDKCSQKPCYFYATFTTVRHFHHFAQKGMMFAVLVEESPWVHVTSVPRMIPVEFIQYLCNAMNIWFGFSIMLLQPKNIMNWYTKHT